MPLPIPEIYQVPPNPEWDPVCLECGICRTSGAYQVWGEGDPRSPVVLLGEALGEDEERLGRPFVGRAGWVLDRALHEADVERRAVFIANAAKCRPINAAGKNRPPTIEELTHCRNFLDQEMAALSNKRIVVAMGASATWAMLAPHVPTGGVMENQGRTFRSERYGVTVLTTVHPALILRKPGEAQWLTLDIRKALEIARTGRLPEQKQPKYRVVRTIADALEMEAALARAPYIVWDWETAPGSRGNALHPIYAVGYCVSFCGEADFAWVVPRYGAGMAPLWAREELHQVDAVLRRVFTSEVPKIGHHVAFDYQITMSTLGVRPVNVRGCTMIENHTLYNSLSERAHGLKRMSDVYTPYGRYDDELDGWLIANGYTKDGKPDGAYTYKVPNRIIWKYNATDSIVPWLIHPMLAERLKASPKLWSCYINERVPLAIEYAEMDRQGAPVSAETLLALSSDLADAMETVKQEIGEMVTTWKCVDHGRVWHSKCCDKAKGGTKKDGYPGEPLNPNSGPQVAAYLYEYQGLPIIARTETGQPSTKEEVLNEYKDVDPLVPPILNYRAYTKLKGSYVDGKKGDAGILVAVDPDGYARPSTLLTAVETLRLATRRPFPPHLIPRPLAIWNCDQHGKYKLTRCCDQALSGTLNIRGAVRPRNPDRECLVARDYSQQEYVLAAIASGQADMESACLDRGEDAHAYVMRIMRGITKDQFLDANGDWAYAGAEAAYADARSECKSLNFMVLYLGGAPHLARSLKIDEAEAEQQIKDYYARLPKIRAWQMAIIAELHKTGRVMGLFGTSRSLPNIYSPFPSDRKEAERQACNYPFQNGGAHLLFRAILAISRRWRKEHFPGRLLFSVHDEILAICRRDLAAEALETMRQEMERPQPELVGGCGIPRGILTSGKAMDQWGGPALKITA